MALTLQTRLKANPDVLVTELTDEDGRPEAVLLNLATHQYFSLNASGIPVWHTCQAQGPLADAVSALTARFEVSQEHAEASVLRMAEALTAAALAGPVEDAQA
ncbi:PqqD family protein [uncultured Thiohalocapsa sp.]|uniref:PqqD family protein n=1 Tax=uncultured Thiohalocapsa sp. TaxID=768990 RepID=UPI0025E713C0|nr:PqqD family protein [uncultured Thiohalocapsa sp.]